MAEKHLGALELVGVELFSAGVGEEGLALLFQADVPADGDAVLGLAFLHLFVLLLLEPDEGGEGLLIVTRVLVAQLDVFEDLSSASFDVFEAEGWVFELPFLVVVDFFDGDPVGLGFVVLFGEPILDALFLDKGLEIVLLPRDVLVLGGGLAGSANDEYVLLVLVSR